MDAYDEIDLILEPASDVTDLEEWYAALDAATPARVSGSWSPCGDGLRARLSTAHALEVADAARRALGDAVVVRSDTGDVTAVDIATGRVEVTPHDEGTGIAPKIA